MTDWDRIVRDHSTMVFATAWRILGHAADTEDVVQEVFMQAHQMSAAEPVRCWEALLRRLASCRALDRLRQRRSSTPLDEVTLPSSEATPVDAALQSELAERLRLALAQLPPREASVFCLRYFDEMAYDEIARALGISPGAVGTALHKARARLETLLVGTAQER